MVNETERFDWKDDDDYENGEVQEPLMHADIGPMSEKWETTCVNCGDSDNKNGKIFRFFWWWLPYITSSWEKRC